jgi:hypothetical protein
MITPEDRRDPRFSGYTDLSILGTKLVESLTDDVLSILLRSMVDCAGPEHTPEFRAIHTLMGSDTNPTWIMARVIDELQARRMLGAEACDTFRKVWA